MSTEPGIKALNIFSGGTAGLTADTTIVAGPFANAITIRRFIFSCHTPTGTSPVLLLNADDGGTDAAGTTAIADRASAAVTLPGFTAEANNVNASDGYKLAEGNTVVVLLDVGGTTPVFPGSNLIMEYVDGIG